jgi:SAM-dependent methyltransferase
MFGYPSLLRAGMARLIAPNYVRDDFDDRHGVDTRTFSLVDADMPEEALAEATRYEPANVQVLHHLFRSLPFRYPDFHLVDVGCGKGRTLMVAAEYPFKAITGVELSPIATRIAERNLSRNTRREQAKCTEIDVRCENAIDFTVPSGNLLVTLYNPFLGKTFEQCIEHLHEAARAEPARQIWVAYINPWFCEQILDKSGFFRRVRDYCPIPRQWAWSLWQHV